MVVSKNLKRLLFLLILVGVLTNSLVAVESGGVIAQDNLEGELPPPEVEVINPYFTIEKIHTDDGVILERGTINAPPKPLPEFEVERLASIQPLPSQGIIPSFPSYAWVFGCSAISGAMIAAYYDRNGYPNMYAGPTNGSVMPLTDTLWSTWNDSHNLYPNNPLVASHMGVDGRTSKGSIDDYWVKFKSTVSDPYITGGWTQHIWSDAIGDYMKTSQSAYSNIDGSTSFYNYISSSEPLTCSSMEAASIPGGVIADVDGTYGRKLFYEARGYSVGDCYSQNTDNKFTGGFSLADFQAEIDAGHPVLLNLKGHSIVGYGYSGSTIYIRDTWSSNTGYTPTMTWGGSYGGMELYSVSVVRPNPVSAQPTAPTGVSASDGDFINKVHVSWNASSGATHYKVYRNTSSTTSGSTELTSSHASISYDDATATPGTEYYYWVKACNSAGCSGFSRSDLGYVQQIPLPPTDVIASDGAFTDKVQIAWSLSEQVTYYVVFKNTINSTDDAIALDYEPTATFYEDEDVTPGIVYYYWIQACNSAGCSDFSSGDSGYAASTVSVPSPPSGVLASDGTYTDKVRISWAETVSAAHYEVYRTDTDSPPDNGAIPLTDEILITTYDDLSTEPNQPYFYWVAACNDAGCSDHSDSDQGWREVYYIYLPLIYK